MTQKKKERWVPRIVIELTTEKVRPIEKVRWDGTRDKIREEIIDISKKEII